MHLKYLARTFAVALVLATCSGPAAAPPSSPPTSAPARPTAPPGLATAPHAIFGPIRTWYLVPDPAFREDVHIAVTFPDTDPTAGRPRARLRSNGRVVDLVRSRDIPASWQAELPLEGAPPGKQQIEIVVALRDGTDAAVASRDFTLSAPAYIVWTLDFEGDASGDAEMENTAAIADGLRIPMTVMWNPRVWTTTQVSGERADAMLRWTKGRAAKGDEVALHLHMWIDFVRAAGVLPRTAPSWAGRGDGYDVPMTAFNEAEVRILVDYSILRMLEHGLPRPVTFRAGGQFADAVTVRVVSDAGFIADCSAVPAGTFGRLRYPWTLSPDAQPYHPSRSDANVPGDLPLLEAPTIGGNTYGHDVRSIQTIIRADLSFLAPAGEVANERRSITVVSHPGTIGPAERAAIEALFRAFEALRYDRDVGPVRFVTLAQLAKAWGR